MQCTDSAMALAGVSYVCAAPKPKRETPSRPLQSKRAAQAQTAADATLPRHDEEKTIPPSSKQNLSCARKRSPDELVQGTSKKSERVEVNDRTTIPVVSARNGPPVFHCTASFLSPTTRKRKERAEVSPKAPELFRLARRATNGVNLDPSPS